MKLNRRRFMQLSGAFAAATVMPLKADILSNNTDRRDIVLTTSLSTDMAFATGTNANRYNIRLTDTRSYSQLLGKLEAAKDYRLFALLQPCDAILLEQALRDSNQACISHSVKAPQSTAAELWALNLGKQLAKGGEVAISKSHSGLPLMAITAYL